MGIFQDLLFEVRANLRPMVLIASLPHNDPALAQAALDGGADMVKFHINVHHHASGTHFGTLDEERPGIEQILCIWEGKPAGIVPGSSAQLDKATLDALPGLGINFLSLYLRHAAVGALPPVTRVERMLALSFEDPIEISAALERMPVQVCELSILHPDSYGQPFTYHDLARYSAVAGQTRLPLVVPTQHKVTPEACADLLQIGVSAVMIGAVVAGDTPQSWLQTTSAFRKAMDTNFR
jgi:hypothetical protein